MKKLRLKSEELNGLACKACTKRRIDNGDYLTNSPDDLDRCFGKDLITFQLKERLIKEVNEINSSK